VLTLLCFRSCVQLRSTCTLFDWNKLTAPTSWIRLFSTPQMAKICFLCDIHGLKTVASAVCIASRLRTGVTALSHCGISVMTRAAVTPDRLGLAAAGDVLISMMCFFQSSLNSYTCNMPA
jgi:hypothetical protein